MKKIVLASGLVVGMIGMGLLIGCGGGGSSEPEVAAANLDSRGVDNLGQNIGDLIPGCVYNSSGVAGLLDDQNTKLYRMLYSNIVHPKQTRAGSVPTNGSCGGTMQQSGTDASMTYQFTNYCTGDASGDHVTVNGSVHVSVTKDGDEIKSLSASTGSSGLTAVTVEDGQTRTDKVYLNGFRFTAGDPTVMSLNELKIASSVEGTYWVKDVYIEQHGDSDTGTVQIVRAVYIDPNVGAVSISTTPISLSDEEDQTVTITVTSQGQTALLRSRTGTAIFDVLKDDQQIGTLDCTAAISDWW